MHFWAQVCANGEWREDHHLKRVCKALREGTGMSKKWILVLQVPLIPEVSFPNSSTHVLPGNYHLSRGEGRNVGVISSGLPRGRWTRYKEKVCISWFGGGLSGSCPILGERHLSNWTLDPIQCVFPWALAPCHCKWSPQRYWKPPCSDMGPGGGCCVSG